MSYPQKDSIDEQFEDVYKKLGGAGSSLPIQTGNAGKYLQTDGTTASWQTFTAGANTALSNLAAVAINTDLLPGTTAATDLGSSTKGWRNLHLQSTFPGGCLLEFSVNGIGDSSKWRMFNRAGGNAFAIYSVGATGYRLWMDEGGDFGLGGNAYLGTSATIQGTTGGLVGIGLNNAAPTERLVVNGNLSLLTAGNKVKIATGANASVGTATLVAGTVTVNTTAVATDSKIFITRNTPGGTLGHLSTPTANIVNGTSFVINSDDAGDTSTVNWWIVN